MMKRYYVTTWREFRYGDEMLYAVRDRTKNPPAAVFTSPRVARNERDRLNDQHGEYHERT